MRLAAVVLLLASLASTRAQDLRGSIAGQVTDPSERVIDKARVAALNTSTGVQSATLTNESGRFALLGLSPGLYQVRVESPGFKQSIHAGITVRSAERTAVDIGLEIGLVSETVTVTADAALLTTDAALRGSTVTRSQIVDLPNNGRNIFQLVWAAPGVTKTSTYWGSMENYALGNATNAQINGGIARENETVMDGLTNTQPNRDLVFQPPIEAVEEARVLTSTYDASYGRFGGGVVAITTRSGSNAFHGTLFETNKSDALAANAWLFNSLGQARPHFINNTFGFQTGAPLIIPKLLDGRNRLFFMVSYEGLRQSGTGNSATIVPTAAQRQGDYSGFARAIYDPLTTRQEGSRFVRTAFEGNRIPAAQLDPIAQKVLSFVPLPNLAGRAFPLNNYATFTNARNSYDQFLTRLDYQLNSSNRVYFSYGRLPYEEFRAPQFGDNSPAEPSNSNPLQRNFYRWVGNWDRSIGPQTTFNLRAGLVRYVNTRGNPAAVGFDPRQLGFPSSLVSQFGFLSFPNFNIGGGYTPVGTPQTFLRDAKDSQSHQANLSHAAGRHLFTAGAEFRLYHENMRTPGRASGQYGFTKGFTQANPTSGDALSGDELASFLLGYPASGTADVNIDPAFAGRYHVVFLQDTWKVTPRLTLSGGVRWDYERPYAERYNRMVRGFAFDEPSPIAGQVQGLPLKGGLLFSGSEGEERLAYRPDRNNIQPRVGFAYQLSDRWLLRGGFGLYYLGASGAQPTTGFSQATALTASLDGGNKPRVSLGNPFPEGLIQPTGSAEGRATLLGRAVQFGYLHRVVPSSRQYSFGIERMLPRGFLFEVSYSGNATRRYPVTAQLNALPVSQLGRPDAYYLERVPNPMAGLLAANAAKNGSTIPRQDLLLPFPQYTTVTMTDVPIGRASYHSMQMRLSKRYASGWSLDLAYTVSKTLEQLSFLNTQDFHLGDIDRSRLEKRLAQFDVPQKLAVISTYALPFGRNRSLGFVSRMISGWQLNGFLTLQSGFPVPFPNAPNLAPRSAALPSNERSLYRAFDTSLFPRTAPNLQYSLRTFPTRFPDVRLYPLQNLDVSLAKKTRLSETIALELRAEFLNAANHPWFSRINDFGVDVTRPEFGWYQMEEQNQNRQVAIVAKLSW